MELCALLITKPMAGELGALLIARPMAGCFALERCWCDARDRMVAGK